jgi:hypothetical protein
LNQQPEGAEIKIPGVGSTPIAISTQLPAAVAQLTQKGEFLSRSLKKFIFLGGFYRGSQKNELFDLFML